MPFAKKRSDVVLSNEECQKLERIRSSETEPRRRTLRAAILLDSAAGYSDGAVARRQRVNRNTVVRCIKKYLQFGLNAALSELPRPGKPRRLSDQAISWVCHCAGQKPSDLGYGFALWTYKLLAAHVRQQCKSTGYPELASLSPSTLHAILDRSEPEPSRSHYYVERRGPQLERKAVTLLHIYKKLEILLYSTSQEAAQSIAIKSSACDQNHGVIALAETCSSNIAMISNKTRPFCNSSGGYQNSVTLLAGLDLNSGIIIETVADAHGSPDFITFLSAVDEAYPADMVLRLILDGYAVHIAKETQQYLATRPKRFQFVFAPKHASWLNLVELLFNKMTQTMLRNTKVSSKQEFIESIHLQFRQVNADAAVFRRRWNAGESPNA